MTSPAPLIDSDTLSEVLKRRDDAVGTRARQYLSAHRRFRLSIITRYEILRGLAAKDARRQIERFEAQCARSDIVPLSDDVVVLAADLYGQLHRRGELISDADLLIAATALRLGVPLVTENRRHFERVPGLEIESWRSAEEPGVIPAGPG